MTSPGETAVPAQAPNQSLNLEWLKERTEERQWRGAMRSEVAALVAAVELLLAQRQAVLDLCDQAKVVSRQASDDGYADSTGRFIRPSSVIIGYSLDPAAVRAALGVGAATGTKGDPEAASAKPERCTVDVGSRPWWMGVDQYDPCRCVLPTGHDGDHECEHTRSAAVSGTKGDPPASMLKPVYVPDDDDPSQLKRVRKRPITQAQEDAEAAEWAGTKGDNDEH